MLNKSAYLKALADHVDNEPPSTPFWSARKSDFEYLLKALYNAFKQAFLAISGANWTSYMGWLLGGVLMALLGWFI